MLRFVIALWIFQSQLCANPCTAKDLERMNASLYWLVAYPGARPSENGAFPILSTHETPKYTQAACDAGWKGVISAEIKIGDSGAVTDVEVKDDPRFGLADAVRQAVRNWRFEPPSAGEALAMDTSRRRRRPAKVLPRRLGIKQERGRGRWY
jgi:TonB family protein